MRKPQVSAVGIVTDFFQAGNGERNPAKGFGLGLAIGRRLADQIGGRIGVETEVGVGSVFTVTVPDLELPEGAK